MLKLPTTAALLTTALLTLATTAPLTAQNPGGVISIEFPGGSLTTLLEQIRKAGDNVNIVASNLSDSVELPKLTLKNATVGAALKGISKIVASPYYVAVETEIDGIGQPVYALAIRKNTGVTNTAMASGPDVAVFSLRGLTERLATDPEGSNLVMPAKTILSAIDAGLSVTVDDKDRTQTPATIRYHEDSGLLFVRGSHMQTRLAQQVLSQLEANLNERRQAAHFKLQQEERDKRKAEKPAKPSHPSRGR